MRKDAVRQRKWAPKVRTGCKSCKIRRKKCDEGKPECARCIKDGVKCDGYSPPQAWIFNPSAKSDRDSDSSTTLSLMPASTRPVDSLYLLRPSTAWTSEIDRNFCQFFLIKFAPLLSTTSQWQAFWRSVVPQAAWDHPAINHAMIAVAAFYESRMSQTDRTSLVLSRSNLAIRALRDESFSSVDVALIVCRLFAALEQLRHNHQMAIMHMNSGQRIFQEAVRGGNGKTVLLSGVVRTLAPTLMALSTEMIDDADFFVRTPSEKWPAFEILKTLRSEYGRFLHTMSFEQWKKVDIKSGLLSIAWSTLTQALSSTIYPDIVVISEDPITPVSDIFEDLSAAGKLMSLEQLKIEFSTVIEDIQQLVGGPEQAVWFPDELGERLKRCVENYLVQAAEIEPRMTAGTFWHEYGEPHCLIESLLEESSPGSTEIESSDGNEHEQLDWKSYANAPTASRPNKAYDAEFERKKRDYYLEHVCHYRSGFMAPFPT